MSELKNYIVETNGTCREPEFFIITAKNEKEAKVMIECGIEDKGYECNIIEVKLLDTKREGVKKIGYSCC